MRRGETVGERDYSYEDRQSALDEAWSIVNDGSEKVEQLDIFRFLVSEKNEEGAIEKI